MEPRLWIENFLSRVLRKHHEVRYLTGLYAWLSWWIAAVLFAGLVSFLLPLFRDAILIASLVFLVPLIHVVYRYFIREWVAGFGLDDAALLVESQHPELANALINSNQLKRHLETHEKDRDFSRPMIGELLQRTQGQIRDMDPGAPIDRGPLGRSRNWFLGLAAGAVLITWLIPGIWERGLGGGGARLLQATGSGSAGHPGTAKAPQGADLDYRVENLTLTFNYPAYTRLTSETRPASNGAIEALPGTEVQVNASINLPSKGGELVLNEKDHLSMRREGGEKLAGRFLVKEGGHYQLRIHGTDGNKYLLPSRYPITLMEDKAPTIVLFLSNPKPVYFETAKVQMFYESRDDFGLSQIDLVYYQNGKIFRIPVKTLKMQETSVQGGYTWELGAMGFHSGDRIQYYLEVKDNDNVFGPNTGQSETFSFSIFDSRKEMEDLIALQDELTEQIIALLAQNLVKGEAIQSRATSGPEDWKDLFASNIDQTIQVVRLAQRIADRAEDVENFPPPYLTLLQNVISGLTQIREEQIKALEDIHKETGKPTPVALSLSPPAALHGRLVSHLERDILFLVKMTNRQKMDQVMDLEKQLSELTETLREEFEKIAGKKAPMNPSEIRAKMDSIRQTLQKIMDQLSRQNQTRPDEFLNPNAFKSLNMEEFSAALDRISKMADEGKIDQALEELKKITEDLRTLANHLNQADQQMDNLVDTQLMEKIDESIRKLDRLEQDEKKLIEETGKINQSLREAQSQNYQEAIQEFFQELEQLVGQIQDIFEQDREFLQAHPAMKQLHDLMDRQTGIEEKIRRLGQKTVDSNLTGDLEQNFQSLNQSRRDLTELNREMDSLRVRHFEEFKSEIPHLQDNYRTLKEMAQLKDLNEFNNLFRNTYPEVFRLQNNLRTTPNRKEDIADQVDEDLRQVTRLNGEISKKLGSMMRSLRDNYQSLLTPKDRQNLERLAREQDGLRRQAQEMEQEFSRMNMQNPMISPMLSTRMGRSQQHMKQAETELRVPDVSNGITSANRALKELQDTREMLEDLKNSGQQAGEKNQGDTPLKLGTGSREDMRRGGSARMQKEKVLLPSEDQYRVPPAFREEILSAMKKHTPQKYERRVMEYYKELVK
ncbi:MAG: hypothetical protein COV67_05825 [Nitrospinae bacterium CG11_big_fil_rev_8_21_14_0_20_56_8]|nr:MAG: hypothetical protein COV67_05825 [Nitrospinae bacterium CG11_big_fil_rev_8_21_14_0_20_56_8]